jgi:hypothetical protein
MSASGRTETEISLPSTTDFLEGLRVLFAAHPDIARSLSPPTPAKPARDWVTAKRGELLDDLAEVVADQIGVGQPWTWKLLVEIALEFNNPAMRRVLDPIQRREGGTPGQLEPSVLGKFFKVRFPSNRATAKWRFVHVGTGPKRNTWMLEKV